MIERIIGVAISLITALVPMPVPVQEYQENKKVINLYKKVSPSIVFISNFTTDNQSLYGSGVIVDKEGTIITAAHVVGMANLLSVIDFEDYTEWLEAGGKETIPIKSKLAIVTQIDEVKDTATIKIQEPKEEYQPMEIRTKQMKIGSPLAAIGAPYKYKWSYSLGVLSAIRPEVILNGKLIHDAIQTDTALNPGNSGGAVFDMRGKLVGIASQSTKTVVAFCIPASEWVKE